MENTCPIGLMIKKIDTTFETKTNNELSKLKLTRSQLLILIYIESQGDRGIEVNQIDIEKQFNLKNPTVTGILNRLEEKSYIERLPSEKNARFKKIIVTDVVKEILNKGKIGGKLVEEEIMKCLTKEEYLNLKNILDKIIKNIE